MSAANSPAATLLIDDCLRKMIKKHGGGHFMEAKNDPKVPRAAHSPFGDFPLGYSVPKKVPNATFQLSAAIEQSHAASAPNKLTKGEGLGG